MNELKLSIAEFTETIKALRDAERGRLLTAMLEYARTGAEPELSGNELYTWGAVKAAVDKQRKLYENKVAGAEKARAKKLIRVDINHSDLDINPNQAPRESTPPAPPLKENIYIQRETTVDPLVNDCNKVIDYLNEVTGSQYKHSDTSRKPIHARLSDGFTVEDCKKVIRSRWKHWRGTEMQQYMRPDTLFRPSKFEAYLNAGDPISGVNKSRNTLLNYDERSVADVPELSLDEL